MYRKKNQRGIVEGLDNCLGTGKITPAKKAELDGSATQNFMAEEQLCEKEWPIGYVRNAAFPRSKIVMVRVVAFSPALAFGDTILEQSVL